jgi:splicing factor 3A subunit 3
MPSPVRLDFWYFFFSILTCHIKVAEKLKQEGRHEIFEQETMEELEDDEGNVYNRKTYDDLKKQGLI